MFVFRNYTIENLFPDQINFSGYDDISYIPKKETDLIWCYQAPITFSTESKVEIINSYFEKLSFVVSSLSPQQHLFVCSLIDVFPTDIVDSNHLIEDSIFSFNAKVKKISESDSRVKFLDLSEYLNLFPKTEWINWKFYFISQMIFSPKVSSNFFNWFSHRIDQLKGYRKKCIVLDLDNTLWGGILGEDGIDGIKIGGDYPGNVFLYFQEALLSLSESGVILTVCSKNNEHDVIELWHKNPFVKLTDQHLSSWRINWNNKADNIREIASELNIGLDSMVFIDDNPLERELVRRELPMVAVPDFPTKPYQLIPFIRQLELQYFRTASVTKEDLFKTAQYKANSQRIIASKSFSNMDDFIKSLNIHIDIFKVDSFTIPRIAQLTKKTNQFNLTTRRYQESDIKSFIDNGDLVIGASVSDKFGDSGITAASIIQLNNNIAHIDSFLLSCRILGKRIEIVLMHKILNELFKLGIKEVTSEYLPSKKNSQVASFYPDIGFKIKETSPQVIKYYLKLETPFEINNSYSITIKF